MSAATVDGVQRGAAATDGPLAAAVAYVRAASYADSLRQLRGRDWNSRPVQESIKAADMAAGQALAVLALVLGDSIIGGELFAAATAGRAAAEQRSGELAPTGGER